MDDSHELENKAMPELRIRRFNELMPHRVREVLLVSSTYDDFILEEDGNLTERIFEEYWELSLSSAPRVTHVQTAESALAAMELRRYDLVISMMRLSDMNVGEFGRKVKKLRPGRPFVLLVFDNPEIEKLSQFINKDSIDMVFMWSGDAKILLAIIKYIEDQENVNHDIATADVRVIILVEDSIRFYSSFLGMLYSELMQQSSSLYKEGVNRLHKLLNMRSRPKILLARNYEQATELFRKYKKNVLAVISDIRFYRKGKRDRTAGLKLTEMIRKESENIPLLLHSSQQEHEEDAKKLGAIFLNKNSTLLHHAIRSFLTESLGFGPFIFRMPDGYEIGRANDVRELEESLKIIPEESLKYHALENHISIWLMARSEFDLAYELRPKKVSDFKNIGEVREFLLKILKASRKQKRRGIIAEYKRNRLEPENRFLRIGDGSIGGKARGLAFASRLLEPEKMAEKFEGLSIQVPQTIVLCTEFFDKFLIENDLLEIAYNSDDDEEIVKAFSEGHLPGELQEELSYILKIFEMPLAIRSSSLLEDSQFQPFAGIYDTIMLPNNDENLKVRLDELCCAIKLVYASTFKQNAKAYIENTARRIEEEKMAVIMQGVVGQTYNRRYYPTFAGVAQSYNYYPIGHQKSEDGIAMIALGLGRLVVDGGQALRFCPSHPQVLPQYSTPVSILKNSQKEFWAIDMDAKVEDDLCCSYRTLGYYDLASAEKDGTLKTVGGVYSASDDQIRDDLEIKGPRVITFNNFLKYNVFPLAPAIDHLLKVCRKGMGCDVEIEFACDIGDWGKPGNRGKEKLLPSLNVLQLRPIVSDVGFEYFESHEFPDEQCICRSHKALGHGLLDSVTDIVYVKRENFNPAISETIAEQIGQINNSLKHKSRNFILFGPGRWGSADPWLGIPVQWSQISNAEVIVEASPKGYNVDPSQGTHFFQNITSLRIGYLTVTPGAEYGSNSDYVDWDYLDGLPAETETEFLRHVRANKSFLVYIDGRKGNAVITKPGVCVGADSGLIFPECDSTK